MDSIFVPGVTPVLTGVGLIGPREKELMHQAVESGWVAGGDFMREFEPAFAKAVHKRHALACNSGSSANLIAVGMMVERGYWKAGDEILCIAASFPTTINPLLVYGLVPVFVDVNLSDYSPKMDELEAAVTPYTTGVMIAHTLGIPYDMEAMEDFAARHGLWVVEDCCDAMGSTWAGQPVGHLGTACTYSFYPAHHITTGEGGAVAMDSARNMLAAKSVRDWGRSCYCDPGQENACGKRFDQCLGTLPHGFDHKYTYSSLGFNLKMPEVSAACGIAQLERAESFHVSRRTNAAYLMNGLRPLCNQLQLPVLDARADPSWFGLPLLLKEPGRRRALQIYLDEHKIASRLVFGGNLIRQPYMATRNFKVRSNLDNTDRIMQDALWIGVHPGLTATQMNYVIEVFHAFFS